MRREGDQIFFDSEERRSAFEKIIERADALEKATAAQIEALFRREQKDKMRANEPSAGPATAVEMLDWIASVRSDVKRVWGQMERELNLQPGQYLEYTLYTGELRVISQTPAPSGTEKFVPKMI